MNAPRRHTSPAYQHLHSSSGRSSVTTPNRRRTLSRARSSPGERRESKGFSPTSRNSYQSYAIDVTPLFSVEAAVRYVEVVNDRIAWTADFDGSISVRSVAKAGELRKLGGREDAYCTCLLFLEKRNKMWAAFSDGFIRVFDVFSYTLEEEFVRHDDSVECMVEMEGSVYTGGRDWKIYQWNPDSCQYVRQFFGHANSVRCLCSYSGETGAVLFSGSDDGTVKAWNPYSSMKQSKGETACIHTFVGHAQGVLALELVKPNNQLWSAGEDTTLRVWDLQSLKCVTVLKHHNAPVSCLALVECRLWSGDKHGRIILWDHKKFIPLHELSQRIQKEHQSVVSIRKIAPTVVWKVWSMGSAGQIHCWNAESQPLTFDGDASQVLLSQSEERAIRTPDKKKGVSQGEVTTLTQQQKAERGSSKPYVTNDGSNQQTLTEAKSPKGRRVLEKQRVDVRDKRNKIESKKGSVTSQQSLDNEGTRLQESTAKLPDASNDKTIIVTTNHKRSFPGVAWTYILHDHTNELHKAFMRETCRALGITPESLKRVSMDLDATGIVGALEISHCQTNRADNIQRLLDEHTFPEVISIYLRALEQKNIELKEDAAAAKEEKETFRNMLNDLSIEKKKSESLNLRQQNKIEELLQELDRSKNLYEKSQEDLAKVRAQTVNAESANTTKLREEYDALKSFVDDKLKPLISRLKRLSAEKDLDLKANEERIRQLTTEVEALRAQTVNAESANTTKLREEYDALKSFVDDNLRPQLSRLKRLGAEKDLDLKANEERIRQLTTEVEALRAQTVNAESENTTKLREEYDALKSFVDDNLRPQLSRLKRLGAEKDLDLKANEERIRQLTTEVEALRDQIVNGGSNNTAQLKEEYDALKSFVDDRLKPMISRLRRLSAEKDLDLKANEERIKQLTSEMEVLRAQMPKVLDVVASKHVEVANGERHLLLDALMKAEESARVRETDLLFLVDTLQDEAKRNLAEREALVESLEAARDRSRKALGERDVAISEAKALQEECEALRNQLRKELAQSVPEGEKSLLVAYLKEVQRRRSTEDELHRALRNTTPLSSRGLGQPDANSSVSGQSQPLAFRRGDLETVAGELRANINEAMRHLNEAGEDYDKMCVLLKQ